MAKPANISTTAPAAKTAPYVSKRRHSMPLDFAPEMIRPNDARPMFGLTRTRIFALMKSGAIRAVKVSPKLTLIETASIREYLASKPAALGGHDPVRRQPEAASAPEPTTAAPTRPAGRRRASQPAA